MKRIQNHFIKLLQNFSFVLLEELSRNSERFGKELKILFQICFRKPIGMQKGRTPASDPFVESFLQPTSSGLVFLLGGE